MPLVLFETMTQMYSVYNVHYIYITTYVEEMSEKGTHCCDHRKMSRSLAFNILAYPGQESQPYA